jgi:hypothetical protein
MLRLIVEPGYLNGIALGYGLGVRASAWTGNFSLHHRVQTGSGAYAASYPMGTRGPSLGIKRLGCEFYHSPPSSVDVKNAWSYIPTPQYAFMAW